MSRRVVGILFGGLLALVASLPAIAGPREEASAVVENWAAIFNAGNTEKIVASYTPDALFMGTVSPILATKPEELRAYFNAAFALKAKVKMGESSVIVLPDSSVVLVGFYEFSRPQDKETIVIPARFTFVMVKRDGAWKIAHHHSSQRPKPMQ